MRKTPKGLVFSSQWRAMFPTCSSTDPLLFRRRRFQPGTEYHY